MSTKITGSISSCYINCNGKVCTNSSHLLYSGPYNLLTNNRGRKVDQSRNFLKFNAKYGMSMGLTVSSNIRTKATSSSPNPSTSSWKKWLIGLLLTVILPAAGHKGGLFIGLKAKIDKAIETVDHVTEVVEEVAEKAEKIVEEVEQKLPGDSKLRESLESFDDLAKRAVNEAKKAEDLVHKVKDVEQEMEEALFKAGKDQAK